MKGDRVEVVVDVGDGVQRFDIRATRAGRRVEITNSRGSVEVTEVDANRARGPNGTLLVGPGRGRRRTPRRGLRALSEAVSNSVRAVLLDLDDTLIEEEAYARAQLRSTADLVDGIDRETWDEVVIDSARSRWHASKYDTEFAKLGFASWEGLWATFEGVHPRLEGLASWAPTYRAETWRAALRAVGQDPSAGDLLSDRYIEGLRSGHPVLPGALELVAQLAGAVPVALVTNGPPDIQWLKINQAGIGSYLSAVVISGEIGIGKPDPAVFGRALELLDVAPEHAVMVGDSWERDVTGALAVGMHAVWISNGRPSPRSDARVSVASGPRDVALL